MDGWIKTNLLLWRKFVKEYSRNSKAAIFFYFLLLLLFLLKQQQQQQQQQQPQPHHHEDCLVSIDLVWLEAHRSNLESRKPKSKMPIFPDFISQPLKVVSTKMTLEVSSFPKSPINPYSEQYFISNQPICGSP